MKRRDTELAGDVAAHVLGTGDGQAVGAGGFVRRLEADEERGGVVLAGVQVVLDRRPGFLGDLDQALAVALAHRPDAARNKGITPIIGD